MEQPPFLSSPPSLPLPSLPARNLLERGQRGAAGTWPPAPPERGLLLPGPSRWQAGQVASRKAARRKPPPEAFVLLPGASRSGSVFPGRLWGSGSVGSPGVMGEVSDPPRRGRGVTSAPLSCSGWMWVAETLGRGWIQHYSSEALIDEQNTR